MPRTRGTKEPFTVVTVEKSTADMVRKHKWPGEPIYQTWRRVISLYNRDEELEAAHFMLKEYEKIMQKQVLEIAELKTERKGYLVWTGTQ